MRHSNEKSMLTKAQVHGHQVAQWSIVGLCFSLSTSRSLFALMGLLTLGAWVFSGQWLNKWQQLRNQPAALWITAFISWIFLSSIWSEGSKDTILHSFSVNWKLVLIPIISTTILNSKWLQRCWTGFMWGMVVLLAHVFLVIRLPIPWVSNQAPDSVFSNPLSQAVGLAIFSALCLQELLSGSSKKLANLGWLICFLASMYAVMHISQQRLGYISALIGCSVVIWLKLRSRQRLIGFLFIFFFFGIAVGTSEKIQNRIIQVQKDAESYEFKNNYTSTGARFHMWYESLQAIKAAPIIGHGVGSYPVIIEKAFSDEIMCNIGCRHPHNQYFFYWFEYGAVGLLIFVGFLFCVAKNQCWGSTNRAISSACLVIFVIGSFVDTLLWYRGFLYLFIPLLALLAIKIPPKKTECARLSSP